MMISKKKTNKQANKNSLTGKGHRLMLKSKNRKLSMAWRTAEKNSGAKTHERHLIFPVDVIRNILGLLTLKLKYKAGKEKLQHLFRRNQDLSHLWQEKL